MRILRSAFLSGLMLEFISMLGIGLVALEAGLGLILFDSIDFKTAAIAIILAPEFYNAIKDLGQSFHTGKQSEGSSDVVFDLLDRQERYVKSQVQTNSYQKPLIQLEHVYYKYDDTQHHALEDINLSIYDGEHIALIGKSGAGKSTLAQVIAQHFKPQYGSVIYKQHIKIGFLSQHPYIFNASIRDNMTMFQKIDEDKILEALDDVNLKQVVNALENGIDTWIGEGGEMLSGGQMRRIELSRLLLLQPDVLIFDEPATGLDVQTEHVIQSVINKKFKNTTIITIAHRENTIKNADRRIKINEGSVESIKVIKQNAYKGGDLC